MDDELEKWIFEDEEIEDDERSEKYNADTYYKKEFSIGLKSPNPDSLLPRLQKENKNSTVRTYQFSYFTESIYNNCKNRNIKPSIIVRWIEDLFSFYSISFNQSIDDSIYKYSNTDQKNINEEEFQSSGLNKKYNNEIPFISNVTNFIKVKKKNLEYLDNKKNLISDNIVVLEKQKMERKSELNKVIEKEKKVYSYFSWYNNLRHNLFKKYNILIEQEIDLFANAMQDFKQYHFAATKILSEYKTIDSLRRERKQIQDELHKNTLKRNNILSEIKSLEDRSNYYQQTINILSGTA